MYCMCCIIISCTGETTCSDGAFRAQGSQLIPQFIFRSLPPLSLIHELVLVLPRKTQFVLTL